jgi:hypothetical protein
MYEVASFIPSKREDWDNGCGNTERADLDSFRFARVRSPMGAVVRRYLMRRGRVARKEASCSTNS